MEDSFNTTYYATIAQIIPVLLLAAVATRYFRERAGELPVEHNILRLSVVLFAIWGEASCITALQNEDSPTRLEDMVIVWAVVLPMLMMAADLVPGPLAALIQSAPKRLRAMGSVVFYLSVIAVVVLLVVGVNVVAVIAACLLLLLLLAFVIPLVRDSPWMRHRRAKRRDGRAST